EHRENAAERRRQCQNHDEGITKVLVVDDHEQINHHRRKQEAYAKVSERVVHAFNLTDDLNRIARRQLLLNASDDLVDVACYATEIAALNTGVNLVDRLDVGLIAVGRHSAALEC